MKRCGSFDPHSPYLAKYSVKLYNINKERPIFATGGVFYLMVE